MGHPPLFSDRGTSLFEFLLLLSKFRYKDPPSISELVQMLRPAPPLFVLEESSLFHVTCLLLQIGDSTKPFFRFPIQTEAGLLD